MKYLILFFLSFVCVDLYAKDPISVDTNTVTGVSKSTVTVTVEKMPPKEENNWWQPIKEKDGDGYKISGYINRPIAIKWLGFLVVAPLPDKGAIPKGLKVVGVDENGNLVVMDSDVYQP